MGASFGASRALVILHEPSNNQFAFPQVRLCSPPCSLFTFMARRSGKGDERREEKEEKGDEGRGEEEEGRRRGKMMETRIQ